MTEDKPRCVYIKDNHEQCRQDALPEQEYCVAHISTAIGLTPQEITLIRDMRKKIGNVKLYKRIMFDSPESIINWLEEITRRDIDRSTYGLTVEKKSGGDINHDLTKLHDTLTKRLVKILELKKKKGKKKKLDFEDIDPATLKLLTEE